MKIISIILIFLSSLFSSNDDVVINEIVNGLKSGNYKEISKHFYNTVDINLPEKEGNYSKTQAEQIIKHFLEKNKVLKFKLNNSGSSKGGAKYAIGVLSTQTNSYRVYFLIKKIGDINSIQQLQIEKNN